VAAQNLKFALKFLYNWFSSVPNFAFVEETFLAIQKFSDAEVGPCNDTIVLWYEVIASSHPALLSCDCCRITYLTDNIRSATDTLTVPILTFVYPRQTLSDLHI